MNQETETRQTKDYTTGNFPMVINCPVCNRLGNPIKSFKGKLLSVHHVIEPISTPGCGNNWLIKDSCNIPPKKRKPYNTKKHCDYPFQISKLEKEERDRTHKDCTVIAMALALNRSYRWAHDLLKSFGRKTGNGFHLDRCLDKLGLPEVEFRKVPFVGKVKTSAFSIFYPKGVFIVANDHHAFAFRDGVGLGEYVPKGYKELEYIYQIIEKK